MFFDFIGFIKYLLEDNLFRKETFIFGESSYIIFEILDNEKFNLLSNLFYALKKSKEENNFKTEHYWLNLLDEESKKYLVDSKNWFYESIIEGIKNSEYILISCNLNKDNIGIIEFEAFSYPYGGTYNLRILIEAFNGKVLKEINTIVS